MSRAPIYDDRERTDPAPQRNGESSFAFFNRVGGAYWKQSRALHQGWAERLGDREYADVRSALRSDNNAQARSAFLELYLHECLLRSGHRVVVHPEAPKSNNRPDFLAIGDAYQVYIEAIAPGTSKGEQSRAARTADLLASVDRVGDPNFTLVTNEIVGGPISAPSATFRRKIRAWLAGLDPDRVDIENLPTLSLDIEGWGLTVAAMPLRRSSRGKSRRSIGAYAHYEAQFINDGSKLVAALRAKDSRYGDLSAPFVIAVGINTFDEDDEDFHDAFYGSVSWMLDRLDGDTASRAIRNRDGYFGSPGAWRNRRVSGVLVVDQLSLHNPTQARVNLWLHPDPLNPLPDASMFPGAIREWNGEEVTRRPALDARTLLGLPDGWPEGDPWK